MLKTDNNYLLGFADQFPQRIVALRNGPVPYEDETPWHHHEKGQIVMPLTGVVTTFVDDRIWLVPPRCAIWLPGGVSHRNHISANADVCMLFVKTNTIDMPEKVTTLSVSSLLRELVLYFTKLETNYSADSETARLVTVLLDQIQIADREAFDFPIPDEPVLHRLALNLLDQPQAKRTLGQWASDFAMSERTLARMIKRHVQLTFGQWRSQLHIVLALQKLELNTPVQTIAEELGYESVSAFITFFKKALGKSPRQYRQERWGNIS